MSGRGSLKVGEVEYFARNFTYNPTVFKFPDPTLGHLYQSHRPFTNPDV
jgi:hypothetical protein